LSVLRCNYYPGTFGCSLGQVVHTQVPLSPSSINSVPAQAGKVTVGLASHWPCVTDTSGITTYGLMALGREMSTLLTLQLEHDTLYLTLPQNAVWIHGKFRLSLCLSVYIFLSQL